jgi:hypothetical protein
MMAADAFSEHPRVEMDRRSLPKPFAASLTSSWRSRNVSTNQDGMLIAYGLAA